MEPGEENHLSPLLFHAGPHLHRRMAELCLRMERRHGCRAVITRAWIQATNSRRPRLPVWF